jgi:TolB-like protein/Flp pilus assembly protein TadD
LNATSQAVFISYASQDAGAAGRICEALRAAGVEVWFDRSALRGGDAWDQKIRREVRDCALFIPVISANTVARAEGYFRLEWSLAEQRSHMVARNKPFIVPVCLDHTPESAADVPESFQRAQWTRLLDGNTPTAFAARIVALLGAPGAVASVADSTHSGATTGLVAPPALRAATAKSTLRRNRPTFALIATIMAILAYVAVDRFWLSKHSSPEKPVAAVPLSAMPAMPAIPEKSVAVLPFVDMSEKKDQEYFSDGLSEEVIDMLTKEPELRVPARTSSFYFKGKQVTVADIAKTLSVAHVLEGSVRKSGNHLRVTAQLIRADNGYHLWSQTYDRDLQDTFKVQDDIANAVVQALQITLMGGPLTRQKGGTENLEAYQLYLRGLHENSLNTRTALEAARKHLEQATKLDPDFALALSALGDTTASLPVFRVLPFAEGFERARELAQRALQVTPGLVEAHVLLGYIHRTYDRDWVAAQTEARQALALNPASSLALQLAGQVSAAVGHWDDAVGQLRAALVRDPLSSWVHWHLATTLYRAGRFAEAEIVYRKLIELEPGFAWARAYLGKTLLAEGHPDEALAMAEQEVDQAERLDILPVVLQAVGRQDEADAALKTLISKFADSEAYYVAMDYAYRGDQDLALQWLERAYKQKEACFIELKGEPLFTNLLNDPRYKAFLRSVNLPE